MSRMMDNLAKVLNRNAEDPRPALHLLKGGVVPSPDALREHTRKNKHRKRNSFVFAASLLAAAAFAAFFTYSKREMYQAVSNSGEAAESIDAIGLLKSGHFSQAESVFKERISVTPPAKADLLNYGYSLKAQGRFAEAEAAYLSAIKAYGRDPVALNNLGVLYAQTGRPALAESHLSEALSLDPNYIDARINLVAAQARSGKFLHAIPNIRALLGAGMLSEAEEAQLKEHFRVIHSLAAGQEKRGEKL